MHNCERQINKKLERVHLRKSKWPNNLFKCIVTYKLPNALDGCTVKVQKVKHL